MYATYPLYKPSARFAREYDEIDLWRESHKINKECRDFIKENAGKAYHDRELPGFIEKLTEEYGLERAMYVVGRSVVGSDWDKRYSSDTRTRAEMFGYMDMKEAAALYESGQDPHRTADHTISYISDVHPCILNDVFRSLMKIEKEQVNLPQTDADRDNKHDEGAEI